MSYRRISSTAIVLALLCATLATSVARASAGGTGAPAASLSPILPQSTPFVSRSGAQFTLGGQAFRFAGTNNYFLHYTAPSTVDEVLSLSAGNRFVVMRAWGFLDVGGSDGSNSVGDGPKNGTYFQYWNGSAPAVNTGDSGLKKLDYLIYKAGQNGVRLVIPFTNNWRDFGGMDQYVRWRGGQYHDQFYTDATIRQWYKSYVSTLLNRVNSYTGVRYKDDPTIMAWELANEPRCKGSGDYPTSGGCSVQTLTSWVSEMSAYVKSIDSRHLLAVGDEGFYCKTSPADWTESCSEGVDTLGFARLSTIDFMSLHLYPDAWGKSTDWGTAWITRHAADARALGKPLLLGEYGVRDLNQRDTAYAAWNKAVLDSGTAGTLHWMLWGKSSGATQPADSGYRVYCPSTTCANLSGYAATISGSPSPPAQLPTATPVPPTQVPPAPPAQGGMISAVTGVADGQKVSGTLAIEAKVASGVAVDSVVFNLAGATPAVHTERVAPYFFKGDTSGRPNGWDTRQHADGAYTLTVTVKNTAGQSESRQIRLTIANRAPAPTSVPPTSVPPTRVPPTATAVPPTRVPPTATAVPPTRVPPTATAVPPTRVPPTATPAGPSITSFAGVQAGQTLRGVVAIDAKVAGPNIASVTFQLSGPKSATHTERTGPYFFMGDNNGAPYGWDTRGYPNGSYTLKATVADTSGRSSSSQVTFTVGN